VVEPTWDVGCKHISYPKITPNPVVFALNCNKVEVAGTDHVAPLGKI